MMSRVRVGSVELNHPVMAASGTAGHGAELAAYGALDSIGAVVATRVVEGGSGVAELNINDIVSGVYFVRMTNNGEITVKKLVIKN